MPMMSICSEDVLASLVGLILSHIPEHVLLRFEFMAENHVVVGPVPVHVHGYVNLTV